MKRLIILLILAILLGILAVTPVMATVEGTDPRDPDLVYLEIRPDLDETSIVGHGKPTAVQFPANGIFFGYSLPVWSDPVNLNEELFLQICVPDRYDGEHDIVVEVIVALSDAGEKGNTYQLDLAWEKVTPDVEVVPAAFHSNSAQRYNLSNLQYYCYRDYFVIDYDAPVGDPIIAEDEIALRLRLGQVGGQYTDLDGELIIIHCGVLFPRGDLLGHPSDVVLQSDAIEEGISQDITLAIWGLWMALALLALFSIIGFWKCNAVILMLTAAASIFWGIYYFDTFVTNLGLSVGIVVIAYALVCLGFAFRCIFWRDRLRENQED